MPTITPQASIVCSFVLLDPPLIAPCSASLEEVEHVAIIAHTGLSIHVPHPTCYAASMARSDGSQGDDTCNVSKQSGAATFQETSTCEPCWALEYDFDRLTPDSITPSKKLMQTSDCGGCGLTTRPS